MPSRSISRLKTDISKKLRPYICLSCRNGVAYQLLASRSRPGLPTWPPSRKTRFYSSVAPTSTVDSRKKKISRGRSTDIPQQYKVLSDALEALIKEGEDYVNKARVRFCRRTLGGSHHRIKIAFLTDDRTKISSLAYLVRMLLVDPLAQNTRWEAIPTDPRGPESEPGPPQLILFKYGNEDCVDIQDDKNLIIHRIPSLFLSNNQLEILVGEMADQDVLSNSTDISPRCRAKNGEVLEYPVHKVLIASENVEYLRNLQRSSKPGTSLHRARSRDTLKFIFVPSSGREDSPVTSKDDILKVDSDRIAHALKDFRGQQINANTFASSWASSNASNLMAYLRSGTEIEARGLAVAHSRMIDYLLRDAIFAIENSKPIVDRVTTEQAPRHRGDGQSVATGSFRTAFQSWSENAHDELRDGLEPIRLGLTWKSLAWWKLPLHSDDVNVHLTELLERSWLVKAEKKLIWLGGRLDQAGLLVPASTRINASSTSQSSVLHEATQVVSSRGEDPRSDDRTNPDLPFLSEARSTLAATSIPPIAGQAQALVLNAGSKTFFTSALATLVYLSPPLTYFSTLVEAGAIGALGVVYSLWSLQRKWEAARLEWLTSIRAQGRNALREVEQWAAQMINGVENTNHQVLGVTMASRPKQEVARQALERAQRALSPFLRDRGSKDMEGSGWVDGSDNGASPDVHDSAASAANQSTSVDNTKDRSQSSYSFKSGSSTIK